VPLSSDVSDLAVARSKTVGISADKIFWGAEAQR